MTHLAPAARAPFFIPEGSGSEVGGHVLGAQISKELGIDTLFPPEETQLDSFGFDPCGYSANGVVGSGSPHGSTAQGDGGGYYTIHVTPEEGWSFASFECNVPLPITQSQSSSTSTSPSTSIRPTLPTLIKKVVSIFQPSRLSITLFVSTAPSSPDSDDINWTAFGKDLLSLDGYDRKDRIGYEFDGYDLVFACFEKTGWVEERFTGVNGRLEESGRLLDKMSLDE
jgi:S-adenosylmethionine decarboxylase